MITTTGTTSTGTTSTGTGADGTTASVDPSEEEFVRLYRDEWSWRTEQLGDQSFSSDEEPPDPALSDCSAEAQQERLRRWEQVLDRLDAIEPERLSPAVRTDYRVYHDQITTLAEQQRWRMYERPANADTSFWGMLNARTRRVLRSTDEAEAYLGQLGTVGRYVRQNIDNMRAGVARGFGPPQIAMQGRDGTIRSVVDTPSAAESAFVDPLRTLAGKADPAQVEQLIDRGARVVEAEVLPAYADLLAFYTTDYLPRLPTEIAASRQPDGEAFYAAQLAEFTTTELTGEEIHRLGLEAVAGLRAEMREVAAQAGFADEEAMLAFMRTDPQFYATSPEQLLREAAWEAKKFDKVAHHYFGRLPRMRFGIEEPPADLAPFYTFGRGGPHRYTLNTYDLSARPLYSIPALTLHEAAPGHAFQIPFALEMTRHPAFRRKVYISAYGEGWGLYSERLGVEMGIYDTPFAMMGMLSYQMWRAVRLVIDPGMHVLGWSRDRARDYLRDNTAIGEHEITTEVDRYIAWPGQACSYYLGMLGITDARRRAETALGYDFSLRAFHDLVLSLGSVPLRVLHDEVDAFIEAGGVSPFEQDAP